MWIGEEGVAMTSLRSVSCTGVYNQKSLKGSLTICVFPCKVSLKRKKVNCNYLQLASNGIHSKMFRKVVDSSVLNILSSL